MPRTRSLAWAELKIGVISVFALVMSAILIFAVGGSGGFFWQNYHLKTIFMDVAGIKAGSPVRVAGVEVGTVDEVRFSGTGVEVWFNVRDDMKPLVTDKSTASIGSISLLGEGAVDLTAAPTGTPLKEWSYVRNGKGTVGKLFTDESLYREFDAFVKSAERVTASLASTKGTAGKLVNDPKLYNELEASVANLNAITTKLKNGEGSLGQLLNDPEFSKSLNSTTKNLDSISGKLDRGEGTAGKLLTDDALYKRIDSMTARIDTLVQQLNDGQGTAGQLLHDKQLYENMNQTVSEVRSLLAEIKKDPKKYLNVKVSIF
jgi:phospholipid/cholesterol/gamma-HCH transport system substrate-binding protein